MKNIIAITFCAFVHVSLLAQRTPVVDAREGVQQARIQQGVATGEITRPEAVRLRSEQRRIRRTERRAKRDGTVTPMEKRRIEQKQNRANRDIRRQKNDAQKRSGAL